MKDLRIGVLMGGLSAERDVSLHTGAGVHQALLAKGYDAVALDWSSGRDLTSLLRDNRVQVAWIALHGTHGEDGCVQGLLECLKIPYTGSGVTASAVAMDKVLSKRLFDGSGLPTPKWCVLAPGGDAAKEASQFGWPVVVKPSCEGSTVGITIATDEATLVKAVELALSCHGETLLERFVAGRELSVGILDDAVLGTVEIRPRAAFYDYEAKYLRHDTEYLVPAPLSEKVDHEAREVALAAYRALGCQAHARVDLRLDDENKVWVLEVNSLPGMTGTSLLPKIAKHAGLDYASLVERILRSARLRA